MAAESENLDARMEAIRIKNEELEKKHQEILEDEKLAAKQGALINLKHSTSLDQSQSHPYDNLDLDFDVKDSDKELAKDPSKTQNRRPPPRSEFSDEIPPDPVNFLREEGNKDVKEEGEDEKIEKPPQKPRTNNNNQPNRNRGPRPAGNNNQPRLQNNKSQSSNNNQEASETGDSPSRPKNNHNNQQRPRPHHNTSPKSHSTQQDGPNSSPSSPQKKPMNPQGLREKRSTAHSVNNGESNGQQTIQNRGPRKPHHSSKTSPNSKDMSDLKNITVQVTTDSNAGNEIRSVKLTNSARKIGSGRVGHGNAAHRDDDKSTSPKGDRNSDGGQHGGGDKKPRNNRRPPQKPKEFNHPTLENIVVSKSSVQDRLAKIAKEVDTGDKEVTQ